MSAWVTIVGSALMVGGALLLILMVSVDLFTPSISFYRSTYWGPLLVVIIGAMVLVSAGPGRSK